MCKKHLNRRCRQWAAPFREFRQLCELQFLSVSQAMRAYVPLNGNQLDPAAITGHIPAINVFTGPGSRLPELCTVLSGPQAVHDAGLLLQALYGLRYENDGIVQLLPLFEARYRNRRNDYYAHLYGLVRLHNELQEYVKGKQLNPAAARWVQGYFKIFGDWQRNGAGKEMDMLQQTVIRPVLALNKNNPGSPFIHTTTENALQCTNVFDALQAMDTELTGSLRRYAAACRKVLRFLSKLAPFVELPQLREPRRPLYVYALYAVLLLTAPAACLWRQQPDAARVAATVPDTIAPATQPPADTLPGKLSRLYPAPFVYGVDVSRYQGALLENMTMPDSIYFVICKATEGTSITDRQFAANWQLLSRSNVLRGAYHFFISSDDPLHQARYFLEVVGSAGLPDIPLIIDVEAGSLKDSVTADTLQARLLASLQFLERQSGRKPIVYTSLYFADTYLRNAAFADYPLWLAEYSGQPAPVLPQTWKEKGHTFWQKSASYVIDAERTDYDVFNGSGADLAGFVTSGRR